MLQMGELSVSLLRDGQIKHDAGVIFGDVPKTSWEQLVRVDRRNRTSLGLKCILIQSAKQNMLIDTGVGNKEMDGDRASYGLGPSKLMRELRVAGIGPRDIDTVVYTHLHFEHSGGGTRLDRWGQLGPTFPKAEYLVQKQCWDEAIAPTERASRSYRQEDFVPLKEKGHLAFLDGDQQIIPGVSVKVTGGVTEGHQIVMIDTGSERVAFLGDLVPTHHHVNLNYIPASHRYPEDTLVQKRALLKRAENEGWLVIFGHGRVGDEAGYLERRKGELKFRSVEI
jgi:glyoxylase-like metal-dependent hydrolase (beta-lactamase superfamily II)